MIPVIVPVKQLSKREMKVKSKPWITRAIRTSIQVKNSHYKFFLKTKSTYFHSLQGERRNSEQRVMDLLEEEKKRHKVRILYLLK